MSKRKKYMVDKKFQGKMIIMVVSLIVGAVLLSGILSYSLAINIEKKSEIQLYGATDKYGDDVVTVTRLEVVKPVVIRSIIIGGVLSILTAIICMLFYSHRLAGPVYRLERHIEEIAEGRYDHKIVLRKKDEFKQLADAINKLEDKLMEKQGKSNDA
ncbi:HAMP domain-containing protein [Elusimicrobiota bacterium]